MSKETASHLTRGRGILTETDRKYLLGEVEYEDRQQQRNRRRYIRDRVRNGIIDFTLLDNLEERDRKQIFSDLDSNETISTKTGVGKTKIFAGMCAAIQLFYTASSESDVPFEPIIENGIREAEEELTGRRLIRLQIEKEFDDDVEITSSEQPVEFEMSISETEVEALRDLLANAYDALESDQNSEQNDS